MQELKLYPPTELVARITSSGEINLSWLDNSAFESQYEIESSSDGAVWNMLANVQGSNIFNYKPEIEPSTTIHYRVRGINDNNQSDYSSSASISTVLGTMHLGKTTLSIYPNPVNDMLYILLDRVVDVNLSITDLNGKAFTVEVFRQENRLIADMSQLTNGLYFLTISNAKHEITRRIVKQ